MDTEGLAMVPLLTMDEVRRRMASLSAEMTRLDRDPRIIARGFHSLVAQAAYAALLADEARLRELPPPEDLTPDATTRVEIQFDDSNSAAGARKREILEF